MNTQKKGIEKVSTVKHQTVKPGYVVALVLKEGTAPGRCYVGEV